MDGQVLLAGSSLPLYISIVRVVYHSTFNLMALG